MTRRSPRPPRSGPRSTASTRPRPARTLSRRHFLAAAGALGLTACVDGTLEREAIAGDDGTLRILTWPDYIDADGDDDPTYTGGTLSLASIDQQLTIDYDTSYTDNGTGFDLVVNRAVNPSTSAYDIVVPTNWRAAQMIENGWAQQIPLEIVPNHANIDPAFLTNAWDRGSRFQMPWQAGITGIAYDPALTGRPITSVADLFSSDLAGRVGFIGEMREAVGLVMLADGADPSRPTAATATAALDRIVDAAGRGQIGAFTFEDFGDRLESGELAAAMAWSGDVALLQDRRPDIEFVVPDEGAIQWFDTMVIPARAPNLAAAGRFMNFVYDPENAARITRWVGYISPVLGVQEFMASQGGSDRALAENPLLFPDPATRARLFTWGGLDSADEEQLDQTYLALVEG